MTLLFRNREMFFQKLNSTSTDVSMISSGTGNLIIETAISSAPGDLLRVERLEVTHSYCFLLQLYHIADFVTFWVAFAIRGKMNDKDVILIEVLKCLSLQKGSGICIRSAAIGDVVEVSYQVRIKGANGINEEIIDGAQNIASQGTLSPKRCMNASKFYTIF